MCTVTFIPVNKTVFITHNRDEKKLRSKASAPVFNKLNGITLLFPKDGQAGGSWVGFNEHGHAAVLLNGAFKNHIPHPPYKKSRGLVFLDLLSSIDMLQDYGEQDLENIEPFTIILWNGTELYECRWDAEKKHIKELDASRPHMWSSSTLYDDSAVEKRLSWFNQWRQQNPQPDLNEVIRFHLEGGDGDEWNDLRMNRSTEFSTLSITAMELSRHAGKMRYIDLGDQASSEYRLTFKKAVVESR
jgi:hypothetical protein